MIFDFTDASVVVLLDHTQLNDRGINWDKTRRLAKKGDKHRAISSIKGLSQGPERSDLCMSFFVRPWRLIALIEFMCSVSGR